MQARLSIALCAALAVFALAAHAACAASKLVGPFRISAKHITFYSNRYVVAAEDGVALTLADGTRLSGNDFYMDLRLNRFVLAGNVKLHTTGNQEIDGAAFAEFFDFDRSYFIPLTDEPDRWTFSEGDFAHPLLGREMPGDTFFLPDLSADRVFLRTQHADIAPRESVRFTPATINFGLAFVPFPSYFLNFSINPNFAQNSLPGAYVDGPLDFAGGTHGLATLHLRYDPANKLFPAIELHQVSARHYVVASLNPLTRPLKQYDLLAFDRISPKMQAEFAVQTIAFQRDFKQPLSVTAASNLRITAGLPHSFLQLNLDQYYDSLLAPPPFRNIAAPGTTPILVQYYGDPSHNFVPDHANDQQLSWTGFEEAIVPRRLTYRLRSGIGLAHNGITPLSTVGGSTTSVFNRFIGATITVPSIELGADRKGQKIFLNASIDKQYQYFSQPHVIDSQQETISISKVYNWKFAAFASYQIAELRDLWGAQQAAAYPAYGLITGASGQTTAAYEGFQGLATTRTATQSFIYNPAAPFNLTFTLQESRNFPGPIAAPLGGTQFSGLPGGISPYQATLDVRYRFNRIITLDLARSYYFNFGGYLRYSPFFTIQVLK